MPQRRRPASPRPRSPRSETDLPSGILIGLDELAERDGKIDVFDTGERVNAELVLQSRRKDRKSERVESAVEENEIVVQRRQGLPLLLRDARHVGNDDFSDR